MTLPTWFRPWMALAALVAAMTVLLGIQTLRLAGAELETAREVSAHAETRRAAAQTLAKAIMEARKTENDLRADIDNIQALAAKEKNDAKAREDALVESVRTGNRRLSIAAVCPGSGGTGIRPAAAGGSGAEVPRADIDPAAAGRIVSITNDGDQAIRERNICIEAYEAVRLRLNGVK